MKMESRGALDAKDVASLAGLGVSRTEITLKQKSRYFGRTSSPGVAQFSAGCVSIVRRRKGTDFQDVLAIADLRPGPVRLRRECCPGGDCKPQSTHVPQPISTGRLLRCSGFRRIDG